MTAKAVARRFVTAINSGDAEALAALMSENHRLVDSLANAVEGREAAAAAWRRYFVMVPGYRMEIEETFVRKSAVFLFGTASGGWAGAAAETAEGEPEEDSAEEAGEIPRWQTPAVWRAEVEEGRVREWRVWADNEPLRALMRGSP